MKKLLLTTTALTLSAGVAAADVALSGDARMGLTYDSAADSNSRVSFTNRARVIFTLSGETDHGLAFGGSFRADNAGDAAGGTGGSVFISGEFGKLSMGDVDSAFGATFGDISGVGLTGLGFLNELSHSADGGLFGRPLTEAQATALAANTAASAATLGLTTGFDYNSLFTANAAGDQNTTRATVTARSARINTLFGGLWNNGATGAGGVITANTNATGNTSSATFGTSEYEDVLIAGFTPAATSALLTGLVAPAAGTDLIYVIGEVLGTNYANSLSIPLTTPGGTTVNVPITDLELDRAQFISNVAGLGGTLRFIDASVSVNMPTVSARVLYEYSIEGFTFALGGSQTGNATAYSVAAAYEIEGFKFSAGYARTDWKDAVTATVSITGQVTGAANENADGTAVTRTNTASVTHDAKAEEYNVGASYAIDDLSLAAVYQRKTMDAGALGRIDRHTTVGLSAAYTMDAVTVSAFGNQVKSDVVGSINNFGIGASYDLGGGASISGGVVSNGNFFGSSTTTADLGVAFSF